MNISSALVADFQAAKAVQPRQSSFDNPAMSAQPFASFKSAPRNPGRDTTAAQSLPIMLAVVAFVRVQFLGPVAGSATFALKRRDRIHHAFQHRGLVDIRRRVPDYERDSSSFDHKMALRARFSAVRRVGTGRFAPPGAGTLPASKETRDQSNCSAPANFVSKARCNLSHTPASCQSRNRRQQVIPLPQPSSGANISHGIPLLSTNKIPVSAARLETRGRPPFGFSGSGGSKGSMICQSSSLTSFFAIPRSYQFFGFC
jgi:hypothetical protein